MAEQRLITSPSYSHEYEAMQGIKEFSDAAVKLILGENSPVIKQNRAFGFQTLSGTGAVRLGAEFLNRFRKSTVYISNPTWSNHLSIFGTRQLIKVTADFK